jgi:hypothetical protein
VRQRKSILSPIKNLCNSLLCLAFLQHNTGCACVSQDVASHRANDWTLQSDNCHLQDHVVLTNIESAPGSAMHWLIITTAMLNSSAMRTKTDRCWPSYIDVNEDRDSFDSTFCCLSESSPRPLNSTRKSATRRLAQLHVTMQTNDAVNNQSSERPLFRIC